MGSTLNRAAQMTNSSTKALSASMGATIKNMIDVIPDNRSCHSEATEGNNQSEQPEWNRHGYQAVIS